MLECYFLNLLQIEEAVLFYLLVSDLFFVTLKLTKDEESILHKKEMEVLAKWKLVRKYMLYGC